MSDFLPDFSNAIKGADDLSKKVDNLTTSLVKSVQELEKLSGSFKGLSNIKDLIKATDELNKKTEELTAEQKEAARLQSLLEKAKRDLAATETDTGKAIVQTRLETQRATQANKEAAKEALNLVTPYQKVSKQLEDTRNKAKNLGAQMIQLEKEGKNNSQEYQKLSATFDKTQKEVIELDSKIKSLDSSLGQNQRNVGNYNEAVGQLIPGLGNLESRLRGLGVELNTVGSKENVFKSLGESFANLGRQALAFLISPLGLAITAIGSFVAVVRSSAPVVREFDDALVGVGKTTGLEGKNLEDLGQKIVNLSRDLKVVGSAALLEYAQVAGQLGVKGSDNILKFAETLAKLQTASDISGEEGAAEIARLLTVVDGGTQNIEAFGDEIVQLGNNVAATEKEILKNALAIGQNTARYEIGREATLAYGAATKAVGLEAEITGTAIGESFALINEAVVGGGETLDIYSRIAGKTNEEFSNLFKEDKSAAFNAFVEGLNNAKASGEDLDSILNSLGITGVRQQRVISTLATSGFGELQKSIKIVSEASGSLDKEFESGSQRLNAQIGRIKIAWQNLILSIEDGKGVLGRLANFISSVLADSIGFVIDGFKGLSNAFVRFSGELKAIGVSIAAYVVSTNLMTAGTVGLTAALWAKNAALKAVALAQRALNLVMRANPFGLIIAAVAGLLAWFVNLYNTNLQVRASFQGLFAAIKIIFKNIGTVILQFGKTVIDTIKNIPKAFVDVFKDIPKLIKTAINGGDINAVLKNIGINLLKTNPLTGVGVKIAQDGFGDIGDQIEKEFNKAKNAALKGQQELKDAKGLFEKEIDKTKQNTNNEEGVEDSTSILSTSNHDETNAGNKLKDTEKILSEQEKLEKERLEEQARLEDEALQKQIRRKELLLEQEKQINKSLLDDKKEITDELLALEIARIDKLREMELELLELKLAVDAQDIESKLAKNEELTNAELEFVNAKRQIDEERNEEVKEAEEEKKEQDEEKREEELEALGDFLGVKGEKYNDYEKYVSNLQKIAESDRLKNFLKVTDEENKAKGASAVKEKALAIWQSAKDTVVGAQKAFVSQFIPGDPTSLPRAIAAAALAGVRGAASTALLVSQAIPKFFKGTQNAPEGLAYTQEMGAELITDKEGRIKTFGHNKGADLTYLEKGDKVYTAAQTKSIKEAIKGASPNTIPDIPVLIERDKIDYKRLGREVANAINRDAKGLFEYKGGELVQWSIKGNNKLDINRIPVRND